MGEVKKKKCAHCEEELTGCPCNWGKTSDNRLVHKKCLKAYEKNMEHSVHTCAHCGAPFDEPSYFKGMDGRDVHFRCQSNYDAELLLKSKK